MSYPKNAEGVLRLDGLYLATFLVFIQLFAIVYLITETDRLTEAQFWDMPQSIIMSAVLVVITSFVIMITVLNISVSRTYASYNNKAEFELMLRGMLEFVASSSRIPNEAKQAFAREYIDRLPSDVSREHLLNLPGGQGKQLLQEAVLATHLATGTNLVRHVEGNGGTPSSGVLQNFSNELKRIESMHEALNKTS